MVQDAGFRTHSPIIASFDLSTASFDRRVLTLPAPLQDSILDSEVFAFYQQKNAAKCGDQVRALVSVGLAISIFFGKLISYWL